MSVLKKISLSVLFISALLPSLAFAELSIRITGSSSEAKPIAIVPFGVVAGAQVNENISGIISADLERSGKFKPMAEANLPARPTTAANVQMDQWRIFKQDYLLVGEVHRVDAAIYEVRFNLLDVVAARQLTGWTLRVSADGLRRAAHHIADLVYEKITGQPGAFDTYIAYVAAENKGTGREFTINVADSDGYNPIDIYRSERPLMSPSWSPDGDFLAYVEFQDRGRMSIVIQEIASGDRRVVAKFKGINGSPSWSPDGRKLAVTLSRDGNADIFILDVATGRADKLTSNRSIDTEPTYSPDGQSIYFTSDRSGSPQIYKVGAGGGTAQRVTFEGRYNSSPSVSADGRSLAFVTGGGGRYRIATLDLQSGQVRELTRGPLNESPSYAPNNAMVIFAAESAGLGEIGVVSADGSSQYTVSLPSAGVREPAWSPKRQ